MDGNENIPVGLRAGGVCLLRSEGKSRAARRSPAGHGLAGGARRAPRLLAPLAAHCLATRPRARLQGLGDCLRADGAGEPRIRAPLSRVRPSEMGTPWHHWSPVLVSLAALFSKGEGSPRHLRPGTNFAGSECVGVCVAGGGRE